MLSDDEFEALSSERRALALAAAANVAAAVGGVEVRVLPADAPLSPTCELWTTDDDPRELLLVSANAVATSLIVGPVAHQLVVLDDGGPDGSPLAGQAAIEAALAVAVNLVLLGVPGDRGSWSFTVQPEQEGQSRGVALVHQAAFPSPDEAQLVDALRETDGWIPGLSLVATNDEGAIVGHILFTGADVGGEPVLALAPVGVSPEFQRRGVGEALVAEGLIQAATLGFGAVAVLGDPAYYGRFGFVPARGVGLKPPADWPDEAFQALSLSGRPVPQGTLRYAAPFGV